MLAWTRSFGTRNAVRVRSIGSYGAGLLCLYAPLARKISISLGLDPDEEDRFPVVWALDAPAAVADALRSRRAPAIHRTGCRGRGAGAGPISAFTTLPASSLRLSRCWRPW